MRHIFKQFCMWYSRQNSNNSCGIALNSINLNLLDKLIIDSGATDHMVGNKNLLTDLKPIKGDQYVLVVNGMKARINGIGTLNIFSREINNVLYIDSFTTNLLSIKKISS